MRTSPCWWRSYLLQLQLKFKHLFVPWWYACDHFVAGHHHQGWATFNLRSEVIHSSLGFVCAFNRNVQEVLPTFGRDKLTACVYQQHGILKQRTIFTLRQTKQLKCARFRVMPCLAPLSVPASTDGSRANSRRGWREGSRGRCFHLRLRWCCFSFCRCQFRCRGCRRQWTRQSTTTGVRSRCWHAAGHTERRQCSAERLERTTPLATRRICLRYPAA